jgi:hypothetical protein
LLNSRVRYKERSPRTVLKSAIRSTMAAAQSLDELGSFYLGRRHDLAAGKTLAEPLLYDSKDLTTHAICIGMTGSGKTGLCLSLLEEAALDGIPAIAIDPKGDLGNLLLAFPNLRPSDFRPWIDESEAARKQLSPDAFAAAQATLWREGLAKWDQTPERIQRFCDSADRIIFTPGSSAGIPISVLESFRAPPAELIADNEALAERISSAVSGLLALLGIEADPVRSREHIFLSNVLSAAWRSGQDLDLAGLMRHIQRPPLDQIGVVDVETFFPADDRSKLAMSLNNLLASPSFASWLSGEPLDVAKMLYTPAGKPRLAIVSIAHLDDAQRMFFVTLLLNEILAWMRTQPGAGSLRALLYMDEVFGYFPPSANPPSKRPMLTLMKQARAFGLGCVLATQNPVDLDYKGLSNAGTWFLGRLQTERDKARVIEGLEGASVQAGSTFDRRAMEATLAGLGSRVFLMNNVHEDAPVVFHTRWAMSYLCGPLAREQIKNLMDPVRAKFAIATAKERVEAAQAEPSRVDGCPATVATSRPILPAAIRERFAGITKRLPDEYRLDYRPALFGSGKVHFVHAAQDVDEWRECRLVAETNTASPDDAWAGAVPCSPDFSIENAPDERGRFVEPPAELAREKSYAVFGRQLKEHLYRSESLELWCSEALDAVSRPGESPEAFRARLAPAAGQRLAQERDKIQRSYAANLADAERAIQRHQTSLRTQRWQFWSRLGNIVWVIVETALRVSGRGRPGRPRSAEVAVRQAATEHGQQTTAQLGLEQALDDKHRLESELREKLQSAEQQFAPDSLPIEPFRLAPRKGDVEVDDVALVWLPWRIDGRGNSERAY